MKMYRLCWILLLIGTSAQAEQVFPEARHSVAELKKAWKLYHLADAHYTLGEYEEAIATWKSTFRMVNDIRVLASIAVAYEEWAAHVEDPKESFRLRQQAVFLYRRTESLLPHLPQREAPVRWARKVVEQHLPAVEEALAEQEEDEDVTSPRERTVAQLEDELMRARDELARERATRAALEQAIRALAAQKPQCPVSEGPRPAAVRLVSQKPWD